MNKYIKKLIISILKYGKKRDLINSKYLIMKIIGLKFYFAKVILFWYVKIKKKDINTLNNDIKIFGDKFKNKDGSKIKIILKILKIFKNFNFLKKIKVNEKYYFYIKFIILLIILCYLYDESYKVRYIVSLIIFLFFSIFMYFYNYLKTEKIQKKIKNVFKENKIINEISKLVFCIINPIICLYLIQNSWIFIVKKIRYWSMKYKFKKYWDPIDIIMYYIIFIYLKLLLMQIIIILTKIKKKIIEKTIKEIINWRIMILIINILIIQKLLKYYEIVINWKIVIFLVIIIINIYIIDKSFIYISNLICENKYNYIFYKDEKFFLLRELKNWKDLFVIFINLSLNRENNYDKILIDFFSLTNDKEILYPYWYNYKLYFFEIANSINIKEINQFFILLNKIVNGKYLLLWVKEINDFAGLKNYDEKIKFVGFNYFGSFSNDMPNYYCKKDKKVKRKKIKLKKNYQLYHQLFYKDKKIVYKLIKEYEKMYDLCINYLNLLNQIYKKTNQTLIINLQVYLFYELLSYDNLNFDDESFWIEAYGERIFMDYKLKNNILFNVKLIDEQEIIQLAAILFEIKKLYKLTEMLGWTNNIAAYTNYIDFNKNEIWYNDLLLNEYKSENIELKIEWIKKLLGCLEQNDNMHIIFDFDVEVIKKLKKIKWKYE